MKSKSTTKTTGLSGIEALEAEMKDRLAAKDAEIGELNRQLSKGTNKYLHDCLDRIESALGFPADSPIRIELVLGRIIHKNTEIEELKQKMQAERVAISTALGCDPENILPAIKEQEKLVQSLADALNTFDYDGHGQFLSTFGISKTDGSWKKIK